MRTKLFPAIVAFSAIVLGLGACSDSDLDNGGGKDNGNKSYIAVNILNASNTPSSSAKANRGTRAVDGYANGTDAEGTITRARFYFFNIDGSPFELSNATPAGVNWIDASNIEMQDATDDQQNETVERTTRAVLTLSGLTGETPVSMVAIANPQNLTNVDDSTGSQSLLSNTEPMSLQQLEASGLLTKSYAASNKTGFVMSNSVYVSNDNVYSCATSIDNNIHQSQDEALKDPVNITVERLAAKVTVTFGTGSGSKWQRVNINGKECTAYDLGDYTYTDSTGVEATRHIYAVTQGWGLADEQSFGSVFKNIGGDGNNAQWNQWGTSSVVGTLGFRPWSSTDFRRSFWEISPRFNSLANDNPVEHPFSYFNKRFYNERQDGDPDSSYIAYTMPNTPETPVSDSVANRSAYQTYRTKVVLAVRMMYQENGEWHNAEVSRYRGENYFGESSVKKVILNDLLGHISKRVDGTWKSLDENDIDLYATSPVYGRTYQVEPVLSFMSNADGYFLGSVQQAADNTDPNKVVDWPDAYQTFMNFVAPADIRHDGLAYYYTTIRHLGATDGDLGYFGVVRNHWYQVNITGLTGWGTPVYYPEMPITPVTPSDGRAFLSARINVLQWRVVNQDVNLDGTEITE